MNDNLAPQEKEILASDRTPNADQFYLWGFDGEYIGNEARLQACLPFFRAENDERIFAARCADWSFDSQENISLFATAGDARRFGTSLGLAESIGISPGKLVVLCGPGFERRVALIDQGLALKIFSKFHRTSSAFLVATMTMGGFETLACNISQRSKTIFDHEVGALRGLTLSEKAIAALAVLRNTGYTPLHDQVIRTLLAERIQNKPDAYRKSLKLGALRLKTSSSALEEDVARHLRVLLPITTLVPERSAPEQVLAKTAEALAERPVMHLEKDDTGEIRIVKRSPRKTFKRAVKGRGYAVHPFRRLYGLIQTLESLKISKYS